MFSFIVKLSSATVSVTARARSDGNSDKPASLCWLGKAADFNCSEEFKNISSVFLQVALKEHEDVQPFSLSILWTSPRTMLRISAGPLSSVSVSYLVTGTQLAVEDSLLGFLVLQHLGAGTKSFLKERRNLL